MIKAAIDIGTNTVLLLVAEISSGKINPLREEQRVPRLGRGVDASRTLSPESMSRVMDVLKEYRQILKDYEDIEPVVTATSAVRDAANRDEFIKMTAAETGWKIRLLSGDEEANCTFGGALSVLNSEFSSGAVVLDIGGGSTEIAVGKGIDVLFKKSLDVGCVRFTERFFPDDSPKADGIKACRLAVAKAFNEIQTNDFSGFKAVGVAGTVTSLAFLELNLSHFEADKINGFILDERVVQEWIDVCSSTSESELVNRWPLVMKGRADIFLAGLLILEGFLIFTGKREITVSTGGIRHGAILADF